MATTPVVFLKETREELKKVVWPTRDEVVRLTGVVIIISVIVGVFLGGLDYILTNLLTLIIK
jgi:preprotein translocase subunit SecE